MLLRAPDQWRVTAIVNFCVWDMPGMHMILGVPVILDYFLVVLVTVLGTAWWDGQSNTEADTVHHGLLQKRMVWKVWQHWAILWVISRRYFTLDSVVGWRFSGRRGDSYAVFVFWTDVLSEQSRTRRCLMIILTAWEASSTNLVRMKRFPWYSIGARIYSGICSKGVARG